MLNANFISILATEAYLQINTLCSDCTLTVGLYYQPVSAKQSRLLVEYEMGKSRRVSEAFSESQAASS